MNSRYLPWYALALALLVVGLAIGGVSMSTLLVALVVMACPVMMMLMMAGPGRGGGDDQLGNRKPLDKHKRHDHGPTSGRS
ncbi:hypothetical protein [Nocardia sp. NBC_00403]|uniref:hypothetical protein n=1 Tax=Nocardia sp. NBC_00403 TaxID=2975990 RepID=UPI002E1B1086